MTSKYLRVRILHVAAQESGLGSPVDDGGGEAAHSLGQLHAEHGRAPERDARRRAETRRSAAVP